MNKEQEIETFIEAQEAANNAENNISLLSAELERHRISLKRDIPGRTSEMQATLSLEMIEYAINELKKANDALLRILRKSGE